MKQTTSVLGGILFSLSAFFIWSVADTLTKLAGVAGVSVAQILALSSFSGAAVVYLYLKLRGQTKRLRPQSIKMHTLRLALFLAISVVNVLSFTHLPLTTVYIVLFMGPLLISVVAALFLNEPLSIRQGAAILLGFVGVVIALDPAHLSIEQGQEIGYIALPFFLLFFVVNMLMLRVMSKTETPESTTFLSFLGRALVFTPFALASYVPMPLVQVVYILLMGACGGIGFVLISIAFQKAPAAIVSPFHYSQILSGALFGYLLWGHEPGWHVFAGAVLIIGAGLWVALEARRLAQKAARQNAFAETIAAE